MCSGESLGPKATGVGKSRQLLSSRMEERTSLACKLMRNLLRVNSIVSHGSFLLKRSI